MEPAQLTTEFEQDACWDQHVAAGLGAAAEPALLKLDIRLSWDRSRTAGVSPGLKYAPIELDEEALETARSRLDWFSVAQRTLEPHLPLIEESGHVVTLFDRDGRMLASAGDPHTLARLEGIHFMPGSNWAEEIVGTNGPGTALASGQAVHVVGAEHFCEAWHAWHCAAAPLKLPGGTVVGALDVSGERIKATPWALRTARLLASLVEQALWAQLAEWRLSVMARFGELLARYPNDAVLAVDATGTVIAANPAARARGVPCSLPVSARGEPTGPGARAGLAWLREATVFPVCEGGARLGACLIVRQAPRSQGGRAPPSTRYSFADVIGCAPELQRAVDTARSSAVTSLPVLLLGESGVGKEVLAQAIHAASPRHAAAFVAVNCAALPGELVESELFGYVEGRFLRGALGRLCGQVRARPPGHPLLGRGREICRWRPRRRCCEHCRSTTVTPVGAARAAQGRRAGGGGDQPAARGGGAVQGRFRLDLFHRLNVIAVTLPPLRERPGDLPALIDHLRPRVEKETGFALELDRGGGARAGGRTTGRAMSASWKIA